MKVASFKNDFAKLIGGGVFAQLLNFLVSPLLSRLFTPQEFGLVGVFSSIVALTSVLSTGRYEMAMVLTRNDTDRSRLYSLCVRLLCAVAFLFLVIEWLYSPIGKALLHVGYEDVGLIFPFALFSVSFLNIQQSYYTKEKRFSEISLAQVSGSVSANAFRVLSGLLGGGGLCLLYATITQNAVAWLKLLLSRRNKKDECTESESISVIEVARKYIDYPKFRMFQDLISAITFNVPQVFLSLQKDLDSVGYYVFAYRIIQAPCVVIREALRKIIMQRFSSQCDDVEALRKKTVYYTGMILLLVLPIPVFFAVFNTGLFSLIFGENWAKSGEYAIWISIWVYSFIFIMPISVALSMVGKSSLLFVYESIAGVVRVSVLFVSLGCYSEVKSMMIFCIVSFVFNIVGTVLGYFYLRAGKSLFIR